ncbi:MAG: bifunctional nuclease family protein [Chloroflexi bacterium]|nr:bifunctional nuclease family protein [Chloroflexota bacterium]
MIETVVESIRVSIATNQRVVILKEVEGQRHLPIWIGQNEADAIAMELQGLTAARPLTHDLLKAVISEMGGHVSRILVTDLSRDVFFARIIVDQSGRALEIDSRPSDAIALAVRVKAPILVDDDVMARAGVILGEEGEPEPTPGAEATQATQATDERLAVFRDFVNSLDLDDLDKPKDE